MTDNHTKQVVLLGIERKLISDLLELLKEIAPSSRGLYLDMKHLSNVISLKKRCELALDRFDDRRIAAASLAICKTFPKDPNGCAALCLDRLGVIGDCRHAVAVHGERAKAVLESLRKVK